MSDAWSTIVRGASACLVDDAGRVLLIHREKEPFRDMLAFPGGSIEADETALAAARRELVEETGYRAEVEPFASITIDVAVDGTSFRITSFAFDAWIVPVAPGETTIVWLTFDEALHATLAPGMQSALIAFQRAVFEKKR